jgi:hypothetical protein
MQICQNDGWGKYVSLNWTVSLILSSLNWQGENAPVQMGLPLPLDNSDYSSEFLFLQMYLVKFGYLHPSAVDITSYSKMKSLLKVALADFQKFYGLPATGKPYHNVPPSSAIHCVLLHN